MSIFLLNDIVVFLFIELILLLLMIVSEFSVLKVLKNWNFALTTSSQYALEKRNYLVNTLIYFTVITKMILFVYFIKFLDELSSVVPGAMCAAGVIGANSYGNILLLFKIFILFLLGIWILINILDLKAKDFPFLKEKYNLFTFIFVLIILEFLLEFTYFLNIPLSVPVYCCTTVFTVGNLPFGLEIPSLLILYYVLFGIILIAGLLKLPSISFMFNIVFLFCAYYSVTYFFGTYVYQLPNHKCPFCMLQKEYYYIGYAIWISLFCGVFFGISPYVVHSIIKKRYDFLYKYSVLFHLLFVGICSACVGIYYLKNGVLL